VRHGFDGARRIFGDAAAPTKPQAAVPLERWPNSYFEPAGACPSIRHSNPV